MKRIILLFAVSAILVLALAVPAFTEPKSCEERGLLPGCLPGQHVNTNAGQDVVGNPHYPQARGPATGDPHGSTVCNPTKGNPHTDTSIC
jgi:hypothetical protein